MTASEIHLIQLLRSIKDPELAVQETISFLRENAERPRRPDTPQADPQAVDYECK